MIIIKSKTTEGTNVTVTVKDCGLVTEYDLNSEPYEAYRVEYSFDPPLKTGSTGVSLVAKDSTVNIRFSKDISFLKSCGIDELDFISNIENGVYK